MNLYLLQDVNISLEAEWLSFTNSVGYSSEHDLYCEPEIYENDVTMVTFEPKKEYELNMPGLLA